VPKNSIPGDCWTENALSERSTAKRQNEVIERTTENQFQVSAKTPDHTNIMPENLNMDEITEARRKAIVESIHPIGVEELKALGEGLFPYVDHPWREKFFTFVTENSGATFHHATTHDRIHIFYCQDKDRGMWFTPGSGMGPMQPKGLGIMKEIVQGNK
jgi:hypothetical protein